jgi:hypothetical protein
MVQMSKKVCECLERSYIAGGIKLLLNVAQAGIVVWSKQSSGVLVTVAQEVLACLGCREQLNGRIAVRETTIPG